MSDYVFLVGDDYESNNKEYVSIDTDTRSPLMKLSQNSPWTSMPNSVGR